MASSLNKSVVTLIVLAAVILIVTAFLKMPDQRTTGQRVGDAIDTLPQGLDKASQQLEKRTPGEKLGDAVKDAGENIKKNTGNP